MQVFKVVCCTFIVNWVGSISVWAHTDVSQSKAQALIASSDPLLVLDVREDYEYCSSTGHIAGAWNLPWSSGILKQRYDELPTEIPILVVCKSGGRSNLAANFLDTKEVSPVYDMQGGMNQWTGSTVGCVDSDHDGVNDDLDTLPTRYNPEQGDHDWDGVSNLTDADFPNLIIRDRVDLYDLAVLGLGWGQEDKDLVADLSHDAIVDFSDLALMTDHWLAH